MRGLNPGAAAREGKGRAAMAEDFNHALPKPENPAAAMIASIEEASRLALERPWFAPLAVRILQTHLDAGLQELAQVPVEELRASQIELFIQHTGAFIGYFVNNGLDIHNAKDRVQQGFLKIIEAISNQPLPRHPKAWSWAVMKKNGIDQGRKERRERLRFRPTSPEEGKEDAYNWGPEEEAMFREDANTIGARRKRLQKDLTDDEARLFKLLEDGVTSEEIAHKTGWEKKKIERVTKALRRKGKKFNCPIPGVQRRRGPQDPGDGPSAT